MALVALVLMFSLAGIPPTVGFYAKLAVLQSVVATGMIWLAVLAVLASLVGAFYYLRVVKTIYFDEPADDAVLAPGAAARAAMGINGALVLALGLLPSPLMTACLEAIRQALGG
jgi:NADH-quinone oxidoreductase subunit N